MTFEEDFPSLKKCRTDYGHSGVSFRAVIIEDVQEHCIYKQKIRNAIERLLNGINGPPDIYVPIDEFYKELGLDKPV